jgi:biopolymer transport protein ExbB/TolQ
MRAVWVSAVLFLVAPTIGLTVTVSGMRRAFASMGNGGIADPAVLSEHIGQVLAATALGLLFSLPGLVLLIISVIKWFSCRAKRDSSAH